jgi:hypothetical protein
METPSKPFLMAFSNGDGSSMTRPLPPMPHNVSPNGCTAKRFVIQGNAVRLLSFLRVPYLANSQTRIICPYRWSSLSTIMAGGGSLALFHARALLEHGLLGLAILDLAFANAFTQLK